MTVADLISKLQTMPQDLPVEVFNTTTCEVTYVHAARHYVNVDQHDVSDYPSVVLEVSNAR